MKMIKIPCGREIPYSTTHDGLYDLQSATFNFPDISCMYYFRDNEELQTFLHDEELPQKLAEWYTKFQIEKEE